MDTNNDQDRQDAIIDQIHLLLEEKRTSLAVMRTGISILIIQLFVFGILIATSRFHDPGRVLHFTIPFSIINLALLVLGGYLIFYSFLRLRHYDAAILRLKKKHPRLSEILD